MAAAKAVWSMCAHGSRHGSVTTETRSADGATREKKNIQKYKSSYIGGESICALFELYVHISQVGVAAGCAVRWALRTTHHAVAQYGQTRQPSRRGHA